MTAEKTEEFSFVLTGEFQKEMGFSAEELRLEDLRSTVVRLSSTAYTMRLLYPSEGSKAVERHFEEGYEMAMEATSHVDYSKKPLDDMILGGVQGFVIEALWGAQPDLSEDEEKEVLAKYQIEQRGKGFYDDVVTAISLIRHGRICLWELGSRLGENMHAVEALALRDGMEDVIDADRAAYV